MIRVTFVCLGNICRSPMAELLFKNMVKERGLASSFEITSGGTFDYEEGSPFYSPAKETLRAHGVEGEHTARKVTMDDVAKSDYLLVEREKYSCFCRLLRAAAPLPTRGIRAISRRRTPISKRGAVAF